MRYLILTACLLVAACGTPYANNARRICVENGHAVGSPGFDRCFESTYAAIQGQRR